MLLVNVRQASEESNFQISRFFFSGESSVSNADEHFARREIIPKKGLVSKNRLRESDAISTSYNLRDERKELMQRRLRDACFDVLFDYIECN